MMGTDAPLIFVVEDDACLRDDLVDYLLAEGYRTMGFASHAQLAPASDLLQPALVLLDLGLPGLDGMDLCPLLRQRWPEVGIVMLTSRSGVAQQQAGLQAGADAYLVKTATLALVHATVASVLRRCRPPGNVAQTSVAVAADGAALRPDGWALQQASLTLLAPQGARVLLSVNEFRLLQAVMAANGLSVARSDLLALVNKADTVAHRRNLDGVISRIRTKVRLQAGADLPLRASYASGYAFAPGSAADAAA